MSKSESDAARTEARAVLDASPLFLDTETTGLGPEAEIIEVGIIDDQGGIVFESLIRPQAPIPEAATAIHGISNEDVADAPTWAEVHAQVCQLIEGRTVAIYNAAYDVRLLEQTAGLYGLQVPEYRPFCAMLAYARYYGEWDEKRDDWKWQRLTNAATQTGIEAPAQGEAHRAIYDCLLALGVMRAMAGSPQEETTMDDLSDTHTEELIRDLARFEDRIAELKGATPGDSADIDDLLNDPEAELMGCEGATLAIEDALQARGIDPRQAVAEYRAGNLSQHQADAWDGEQDDDAPERSEAYRDGHESASETLGAASNPFTALCENGDEAACRDADNWQMGADAAQADLERADY